MKRTSQRSIGVSGGWVTIDVYGDPGATGLVVLPGVMSDAASWGPVASGIESWPSVTVLNRRGRAPSGPLPDDYSAHLEVDDLETVLDEIGGARTVFGWSYGGLVALLSASRRRAEHVIAYEPVVAPFGASAVAALGEADEAKDWDRSVEIVNREVSGFTADYVDALRDDVATWDVLRRLSVPLFPEVRAIQDALVPDRLATLADRIDLVIGSSNRGTAPYGTAFDDVVSRLANPLVHELAGHGHLAHVTGPAELAQLIDALAGTPSSR